MNKGELMKDNIFKTIQDNALYAKKRDHKIDITDVMNDYTLNDIKYNPQEVSLFVKDDNYMPDKKAIEKEFEKNRKLFDRFKEECKDILTAQLSKPKA